MPTESPASSRPCQPARTDPAPAGTPPCLRALPAGGGRSRHPHPGRAGLVGAVVGFGLAASAVAQGLPAEVDIALQRAQVPRSALAVTVQEVGRGAPRLAWQADLPVKPASLMKLVTTTAALELLGPAWSWSTPVWLQGPVRDGVLEGDLVIKGSGDPKFVMERAWLLLRRVRQLGVREIRGDIVLDRSAFAVPRQDPADFDGEVSRPYNVLADALMINYKAVVFTYTPDPARGLAVVSTEPPLAGMQVPAVVPLAAGPCGDWRGALKAVLDDPSAVRFQGSYAAACGERQWPVAYADPGSYNGRALTGLWLEMGGRLTGRARDGAAPSSAPTFEVRSPGLAEVVRDINKFSNNVMAQQLYLTLGLTLRGSGTPEAAHEAVKAWLEERHGNAATGTVIDNGSGLSRSSRTSAQLLAQLLQSTWSGPVMSELMSSLPASGLDGTLKRASGVPAGRAHLKTGSLRDVAGIAGYVLANSGRRYVVVAIVNHANAPMARPVLDAIAQWAAADVPAPLPMMPPQAAATSPLRR